MLTLLSFFGNSIEMQGNRQLEQKIILKIVLIRQVLLLACGCQGTTKINIFVRKREECA